MSNDYKLAKEKDNKLTMREWCKRPGKRDENGKIMYFTQQSHKKECDVNYIIEKYDKHGVINHVQKIEAKFGDATGLDFRKAQDLYLNAQNMFEQLPANIKKRFNQNAGEFLEFMEDEGNRAEAIELGLIRGDTKEEYDGLGEKVSADDYKNKDIKKKNTKNVDQDGNEIAA